MAEKDIKAALRKQKNCPECLEAIGRIAVLEAGLEASQEALAEILVLNKANQDRAEELKGEVDRLVRINKSFGAEIKRLRKLKGEPDNWPPTLDKGEQE